MSEMTAFEGFPAAGLHFLAALAENNNREWFQAHKGDYVRFVQDPARDFVFALGQRLKILSMGITYDLRTDGRGSLLRIYRDVRFSKDKRPYHTNVRVVFWEGPETKMENPGFFVRIDPDGAGVFVGQWHFPRPFLGDYRDAVAQLQSGRELEDALASVRNAGAYAIGGEHYRRVPRGYAADHERADLLRHNGLFAHSGPIPRETVLSPQLVDVCFGHCRNMAPLHHWLVRVVEQSRH